MSEHCISLIQPLLKPSLNLMRRLVWYGIKAKIRDRFPTVPSISTQELADWLRQPDGLPWLLDVRTLAEFQVSHLPNAHHAPDLSSVLGSNLTKNQAIVAYCSVGYRSARLLSQLQAAGFAQVWNLEGSIFQWFNEARPVVQNHPAVQGQQPAHQVHPYNGFWGLLVQKPSQISKGCTP